MMEVNIKITLTDGTSYKLKPKEKLGKINPSKKAIFMFNNLEFYEVYTSGDILDDGETEYFTIRKAPSEKGGIGLPYNRLVGWAYKKQKP